MNHRRSIPKNLSAALLLAGCLLAASPMHAQQHTTALQPDATTPHRTRLILKDGSYQVVMSYRVVGNIVRYISAERAKPRKRSPSPSSTSTPPALGSAQRARRNQPRQPNLPHPSTPNCSKKRPSAPL